MNDFRQDVRYALRSLLRAPVFTAVAVLTLALGIGANTAIFSLIDGVLLEPLAYANAGRLVAVFSSERGGAETRNPTSPANFLDWQRESRTLEHLTAARPWSPTLRDGDAPEQVGAIMATGSLFELLGVAPELGRTFRSPDPGGDAQRVVVIGNGLWRRRFGGDPSVIGSTLTLDGEAYEVIGVMPRGFEFPPFWATGAELWAPLAFSPDDAANRSASFLRVFGRLAPGATVEEARAEVASITARLAADFPEANEGLQSNVESLSEPVVGEVRSTLFLLLGVVALVLLIAATNVANLLLGRVAARERESAIRVALGAGRRRLARQWLTESAVLSVAGGALGVLLAAWGIDALAALSPTAVPRLAEVRIDGTVLAFTLLVSLATVFVFGAGAALRAARAEPGSALRTRAGSGAARRRVRYLLVGTQIALAVVLLVGSGLLVKSLLLLQRRDAGFAVADRVTMRVSLSGTAHAERQTDYFRDLVERVEALPGVRSAGVVNHLPISGDLWRGPLAAEGAPPAPGSEPPSASYRVATAGYFEAMGIPLLRGRAFTSADAEGSAPVVLVNRTLAERLLAGRDPVGSRIRLGGDGDPWLTVVGVVGDASQESLLEPVIPEVYFPYTQNPVGWFREGTLVVHAAAGADLAAALRREASAIDPGAAVADLLPLRQVLAEDLRRERTNSWLLGVFAAIAVALALVGLYGVISYLVGQRTHEMGVRVALGARAGDITRMVLGESLAVTGAAVGVGLVLALLLTRLLVNMLYGVAPTDPVIFAGVAVGIAAVATLASAVPARRASRVDPMTALRGD